MCAFYCMLMIEMCYHALSTPISPRVFKDPKQFESDFAGLKMSIFSKYGSTNQ